MHVLQVGQLYHPGRTRWPESPLLRMTSKGMELALFYSAPTSSEIREVKNGLAQWAWISGQHAGLLLFRFGTQPWADTPYQAHRDQDPAVPGNRIQVVLVDASTGIVRALRATTWSEEFTAEVRANVAAQLAGPANDAGAGAEIDGWYAYETADLARNRATVKC